MGPVVEFIRWGLQRTISISPCQTLTRNPLGTRVVHFLPFSVGVCLLKLLTRKKGTLVINGLLGNRVLNLPSTCKKPAELTVYLNQPIKCHRALDALGYIGVI